METNEAKTINVLDAVTPQTDSIISRTIYSDDRLKAVLFGFGAGQEMSEHTSSKAAVLHFLSGQADVTVGGQSDVASAGTWIHMAAGVPHSIVAQTPTVMLLLLLK